MVNLIKYKKFLIITAIVVFIDQVTKYFIRSFLTEPKEIINGIFYLTFAKNTGAGFSLFANLKNSNTLLIFSGLIIIGVILLNFEKIETKNSLAIALIIGGAFGNLIDRIFMGYVVDFLDFRIWPIFNLADTAISIGGILLFIAILMEWKTEKFN
jgi:signal peptidase II